VIPLAGSEILRVRSRRVLWVLSFVAIAGVLVGVTIGAVNSRPPTAAETQAARVRYDRAIERCMTQIDRPPEGTELRAFCESSVASLDQPGTADAMELRDGRRLLEGLSTMVILLGVVLGATLVGADWASGTFATLLTWEPRRVRVVVVRLLVIAFAVVVVTGVIQLVFIAAFRLAVALRGSTVGASSDWLLELAGVALRVSLGAAALAVIAGGIATIGRSTVLAVGSLFAYLVIVEGFLVGLVGGIERWLLIRALTIVVSNQPSIGFDGSSGTTYTTSVAQGRVIVLAYVVALTALAIAAMQRRDVQ